MAFTISLSQHVEALLRSRAQAAGKPMNDYAAELVERAMTQPTLQEILAPVHEEFRQSGMTEAQLDAALQESMDASRRERRLRKGA